MKPLISLPMLVLAVGSPAAAQEASKWPANLQASGFVDTYVMVNVNNPASRTTTIRAFDTRYSEFALNLAELAVWSAPEPIGFRIDLDFGPTAEAVAHDPANQESVKHIQQAYGSAKFHVGNGLTLDVGKMVTMFGQEVIETRDNWNYSRSLLFTWAIPFFHMGARATYPWSDKLSTSLMVVNGWDSTIDNNAGKSIHLNVTMLPTSALSLYLNYMGGPEQADNNDDFRHLVDVVAIITATDSLTLGVNGDYGLEKFSEETAKWFGAAGSARFAINDWAAFATRGEWFKDEDGARTGAAQTIVEGTATLEAKYGGGLIARLEYRHDHSDLAFFQKESALMSPNQDTFTLGTVIGF